MGRWKNLPDLSHGCTRPVPHRVWDEWTTASGPPTTTKKKSPASVPLVRWRFPSGARRDQFADTPGFSMFVHEAKCLACRGGGAGRCDGVAGRGSGNGSGFGELRGN